MTNNTNADLDRDIAHLIDCSESGIARVPRETLVRLRALLTSPRAESQDAQAVAVDGAATDQGSALGECVRVLESCRLLCNWPDMRTAIDGAIKLGRAAVSPATADERAAQMRDVFKRHAPVWINKYPDVCSQIADELFARASQAAAPASHPLKQPMLICASLAAAPAEAREPDAYILPYDLEVLKTYSAQCQVTLYREPRKTRVALYAGPVPADAGEAVAPVVAALRKLVHLKSLKDGADRCVPGYIEDRIEYQRDKPKAWEDARAALASFDAAQGAQGGKGGE